MDPESRYYMCELCNTKHSTIECFTWHVQTKNHQKKVYWAEYDRLDNDPSTARMGATELGIPREIECRGTCWFKCSICDSPMYSIETVISHCRGRRHQSHLKPSNFARRSSPARSMLEDMQMGSSPIDFRRSIERSEYSPSRPSPEIRPRIGSLCNDEYELQHRSSVLRVGPIDTDNSGYLGRGLSFTGRHSVSRYSYSFDNGDQFKCIEQRRWRAIPPPPNYHPIITE